MEQTLFNENFPDIDWNSCIGSGISCFCYSTSDDNVCFKLFHNKLEAEFTHNVQNEAASANLAPLVYSPVFFIQGGWGYFVEKVNIEKIAEYPNRLPEDYRREFDDLVSALGIFFNVYWGDRHCGNIGYKNFRMVWIDFGKIAFCPYRIDKCRQLFFDFA